VDLQKTKDFCKSWKGSLAALRPGILVQKLMHFSMAAKAIRAMIDRTS
jgi:hypothetical protein